MHIKRWNGRKGWYCKERVERKEWLVSKERAACREDAWIVTGRVEIIKPLKVAQKSQRVVLTKNRELCVGFEEVKQLWGDCLQGRLRWPSQHWSRGVAKCSNYPLLSPSYISTTNTYWYLCAEDAKIGKTKNVVVDIYASSWPYFIGGKACHLSLFGSQNKSLFPVKQ